tara:strand:+ start:152 stop:664 length:513 start_codon:yes stop_codon:yes gene_type:complete
MKLTLVRHGQTVENLKGIIQGQRQGRLTELGISQAKELALLLKNEKYDEIYSSDLERAKDTTNEILKFHNNSVVFVKELRERGLGVDEGKSVKLGGWRRVGKIEGAESVEEFQQRAKYFLDNILDKTKSSCLVVSHRGLIAMICSIIEKKSVEDALGFDIGNCEIKIYNL